MSRELLAEMVERETPRLMGGVPHEVYHADPWGPSLSRSIAHLLVSRSPLHAWAAHPRLGNIREADESEAKDNGSLIHQLLLGSGPDFEVVDAPDWRRAQDREIRDAARERGAIPVLVGAWQRAAEAADKIAARLFAADVVPAECVAEQVALWPEDGVLCRARWDLWLQARATIFDVKVTYDATPARFARRMIYDGLDIQAAAYTSAAEAIFPELAGRVRFEFLVCEPKPPYAVVRIAPRGTMRSLGRAKWRRAVNLWRQSMESGEWPGYGDGSIGVDAPAWALTDDMLAEAGGLLPDPDWMED